VSKFTKRKIKKKQENKTSGIGKEGIVFWKISDLKQISLLQGERAWK